MLERDEEEDEITHRHVPFSVADANDRLSFAVTRVLEGELGEVRRAIEALPATHPRRRLLVSSLHKVVAMLQDLPSILTVQAPR
ncbi:MAG: hypothetical protein V4850_27310 [Myxococcota bacterium]